MLKQTHVHEILPNGSTCLWIKRVERVQDRIFVLHKHYRTAHVAHDQNPMLTHLCSAHWNNWLPERDAHYLLQVVFAVAVTIYNANISSKIATMMIDCCKHTHQSHCMISRKPVVIIFVVGCRTSSWKVQELTIASPHLLSSIAPIFHKTTNQVFSFEGVPSAWWTAEVLKYPAKKCISGR